MIQQCLIANDEPSEAGFPDPQAPAHGGQEETPAQVQGQRTMVTLVVPTLSLSLFEVQIVGPWDVIVAFYMSPVGSV